MSPRKAVLFAMVAGIVSVVVALAIAEVVAVFTGAEGSPLVAIGHLLFETEPSGLLAAAIAGKGPGTRFVVLIVGAVAVTLLTVVAGLLEFRRPPRGVLVLVIVSAVSAFAAVTREGATGLDLVPSVVGLVAGAAVLRSASVRLRNWDQEQVNGTTGRRSFLRFVGVAGVAAIVAGAGARVFTAASAAVTAVRQAVTLPPPARPAPTLPPSALLDDITGISPFITPNSAFFRVDNALSVPSVDPANWTLRIHGLVEEEVTLTWAELLALPLEEHLITLACVSNDVGGELIGTARWLGYRVHELLARARPLPVADMVLSRSVDGFTASSPLEILQDPDRASLLAVGMNGEPLPVEHGFPVRMIVPGLYGYVSATKWVTELKVTTFAADRAYWSTRGRSERAPVKIESRIDMPKQGRPMKAGRVVVAGVAWAPHTGIAKVEIQVDGGDWQQARLADVVTADTWVQWVFEWDATAGDHVLVVRATDTMGLMQTSVEAPPSPNGASGWHTRTVAVS
ncbi:molybdopterin-dependent oxidoreductase [Rathayibacter toxicus]|uniref:molybdopterin-dependent oxidoreductase n=1 Tax=Rathayibacter toxicus TaxID=145458 RepID=UPI000CE83446|nr:molybdopterin-dependent oxidoreductase [Rathayibacter toxicus]PPI56280.1 oxidoreductase [Rathayibacter toxicus]QOD09922.1 molybdopterin-dependent oxidoreductase [Rathayibacter toxicus]QWL28599.1 oxidoreductase [Rathayibacter toxicus]QWL32779.1 oxidoreductase [Rathayibacter toxicus]QWL34874.1 oxidoreductase [Rathayibacter toxicus]